MDANHSDDVENVAFDRFARLLGTTRRRRTALGLVLGTAMGGLTALLEMPDAGARGKGKKKKKKKKEQKPPEQLVACPDDMVDCGEGVCVPAGECCPWEKPCGEGCIQSPLCCPETERQCAGGTCAPKGTCCPIIEEPCGTGCCLFGTECCHGKCGGARDEICTSDGWCSILDGDFPCCTAENGQECPDDPCCRFSEGEGCCPQLGGGEHLLSRWLRSVRPNRLLPGGYAL